MGTITVTQMFEITLETRIYVDEGGRCLGDYAPLQDVPILLRKIPEGATPLPADAPMPPSLRHIWNGSEWIEPAPTEAELAAWAAEQERAERKAAAQAKLEKLGITPEDIKALQ